MLGYKCSNYCVSSWNFSNALSESKIAEGTSSGFGNVVLTMYELPTPLQSDDLVGFCKCRTAEDWYKLDGRDYGDNYEHEHSLVESYYSLDRETFGKVRECALSHVGDSFESRHPVVDELDDCLDNATLIDEVAKFNDDFRDETAMNVYIEEYKPLDMEPFRVVEKSFNDRLKQTLLERIAEMFNGKSRSKSEDFDMSDVVVVDASSEQKLDDLSL